MAYAKSGLLIYQSQRSHWYRASTNWGPPKFTHLALFFFFKGNVHFFKTLHTFFSNFSRIFRLLKPLHTCYLVAEDWSLNAQFYFWHGQLKYAWLRVFKKLKIFWGPQWISWHRASKKLKKSLHKRMVRGNPCLYNPFLNQHNSL